MNNEPPRAFVSALDEWLDADSDGQFVAAIMEKLSEMNARLDKEGRKLQRPETYEAIRAAKEATREAEKVMRMYLASKE